MQMRRHKLRTTFWYLIEFELNYNQQTLQNIPHLMGSNLPTTIAINVSTPAAAQINVYIYI